MMGLLKNKITTLKQGAIPSTPLYNIVALLTPARICKAISPLEGKGK
jgi:hypothetical protein